MMAQRTGRAVAAARLRLGDALTKHVVSDFSANGAEVVAKLRQDKPLEYVKLVQAILEKEDAGAAALNATYNVIERHIIQPPENPDS
jgi:hypothetical protein